MNQLNVIAYQNLYDVECYEIETLSYFVGNS